MNGGPHGKALEEKKTDPCTGLHLTSPFLLFAFQVAIQTVSSWKCGDFHVEPFTYSNGPWTDLGLEKELCFGFMAKHCQQLEAHALQWPVCPLTTAAASETVMNAEVPEMTVEQLMCPKFYSPSYASCGSQTQWLFEDSQESQHTEIPHRTWIKTKSETKMQIS